MKTIIFGSRLISAHKDAPKNMKRDFMEGEICWMMENLDDYHKKYPITEVVCGCASGADFIGAVWAKARNLPIKLFPYLKELGKRGGIIRNEQMGVYADRGIAFWDGFSSGTKHMIDYLDKLGKPCTIWRLEYMNEDFKNAPNV